MSEPQQSPIQVGDVIQIHDGPGVPASLKGKYWRVIEGEDDHAGHASYQLDGPYDDAQLTTRTKSSAPLRLAGAVVR